MLMKHRSAHHRSLIISPLRHGIRTIDIRQRTRTTLRHLRHPIPVSQFRVLTS